MLLKTRLRVLLVSVGVLAATVAVVVAANDGEDIRQVAEVERVARSETLGRVFALTARARATWVYDNTFWDEAVTFVRGGGADMEWAEVSYGGSLGMLEADGIFVFDPSRRRVYGRVTDAGPMDALSPPTTELFGERRVLSYYRWVGDTLVEVNAATLHPSDDAQHAGAPEGVVAVVKRWDAAALAALGKSLDATLSVARADAPPSPEVGGVVVAEATLPGPDGAPVGVLRAVHAARFVDAFAGRHLRATLVETVGVVGGAFLLALLLHRWIILPLARLERSLATRDPRPLAAMAVRGDELGALARLLTEHFGQSERMAREIEERLAAEVAVKQSLHEKEVLLQEIHHRVKNNLQVISSLLGLQADQLADDAARQVLQESVYRVRSMALVHQQLYGEASLARVDLGEYARSLAGSLRAGLAPGARVEVLSEGEVGVSAELAVPVGLILNELLTNAFKYGLPAGEAGRTPAAAGWDVRVQVRRDAGGLGVCVCDRGPGLPEGFALQGGRSLGLRLVSALLRQVRGSLDARTEGGAVFELRVPLAPDGRAPA